MRSILKIMAVPVMVFFLTAAHAQVRDTSRMDEVPNSGNKLMNNEPSGWVNYPGTEYVFKKNGVMMLHKNGYDVGLYSKYYCKDGSTVSTSGTLKRKDGSTVQLNNGDEVTSKGKLETADK